MYLTPIPISTYRCPHCGAITDVSTLTKPEMVAFIREFVDNNQCPQCEEDYKPMSIIREVILCSSHVNEK